MISKKLAKAINDQINAEMWSAYLYLSMSQDIYAKGFKGIAHWYKVQFLEEQAHAAIMINYMHSQDAKVVLAPIAKVQTEWKTVLAAFEDTLEHEKKVTAMINNLCDIADEDKDRATGNFLAWFIDEQVEEEENARDLIAQCKMIDGNMGGMMMLDKELGAREYHTPAPLKGE
jgi:ferritin